MDYVKYVSENKHKFKNYEWLKQFDKDTDGQRFIPTAYPGMKLKYGLGEPLDGIAGDRWMKKHAKTDILNKVTLDNFRRGLSIDEYNDIINYSAWNTWDILSLRAKEGLSELIPRQQYEFIAFVRQIIRGAEFNKLLIHKVGWKKYMRRIHDLHKELGAKTEHTGHTWGVICLPLFGAIALESLGYCDPDDPLLVEKKKWAILPWAVRGYAFNAPDGYMHVSQNRYGITKDQSVVDFIMNNMSPVDDKKQKLFHQLNAASTLLGFSMHYDNRAGQSDYGPHIVEDGKLMVIHTTYLNDPEYYWSELTNKMGLPFSVVLAYVINPDKIGLQEFRVNDIGTSFSRPANFWPGVEQACAFLRYEPDGEEPLPLSKLKKLDWNEIPDFNNQLGDASFQWYSEVAKMMPRQKVWNGYQTYAWDPGAGTILKCLGVWDYFREKLDFWELPPIASDSYYQVKGKVATEVMPHKLFSGAGWSDIPAKLASISKYRDNVLKRAYDLGWMSDLTGMSPIPEELKSMMNEDRILQVNPKFDVPDNWWKD